jgi:hypothetical protein
MTQAKQATPTVTFVDEYCALYQDLFPDVRSFDHFKQLQIGMLEADQTQDLACRSPRGWRERPAGVASLCGLCAPSRWKNCGRGG